MNAESMVFFHGRVGHVQGLGDLAVCRRILVADPGEFEKGVDGGFEGTGVALDLGEEETALEYGEEGDSEVVRVDAVQEVPGVVKTAQPVADCGGPLPESRRDQGAGLHVGLGELPSFLGLTTQFASGENGSRSPF